VLNLILLIKQKAMQKILEQYSSFNVWAHGRLKDCMLPLPTALHTQTVKSSFASLNKTLLHMWDAESAWWQRIHNTQPVVTPSQHYGNASMKDIYNGLIQQSEQWQAWASVQTEDDLSQIIPYKNMKGDSFEQPLFEIAFHVINHATYHRGQLVSILRGLDVTTIPSTDFTSFCREK
jgi:uncharacterized damage-inducible protein DinB